MGRKNRLRNTAIGIAVAIALFLALGSLPQHNEDVQHYAETQVLPIEAETLARLVNNSANPTLVFFYATWCPYCKDQFRELDTIAPLLVEKNVQKIYIAVDEDRYDVAKFLLNGFPKVKHAETQNFTPHWLEAENKTAMQQSLKQRGLSPKDTIPYLIVFSPFGKETAEFHGLTEHYRISHSISSLKGE